jgi:hypothetical protein
MPPTDRKTQPDPEERPTGILDPTGRPASDQIIGVRLADLEAMLTRVVAAVTSGQSNGGEMLKLATAAMDNLKEQVARNRTISNSINDYHGVSEFAPEGKAKKREHKLRYKDVFFLGDKLREESLTPDEIDILNSFKTDTTARDGRWVATITRESGKPVLTVTAPFGTMDNRNQLPSLLLMCDELLHGPETNNPDSMLSRLLAAEKTIRELQEKVAVQ